MTNTEEILYDMFADLLDEHFPKGQCKERGQALVVVGLATMKLKRMFAEIEGQNPNNISHKDSCSFQACDCRENSTGIDLGENKEPCGMGCELKAGHRGECTG